jgi:hypothetical protein
MGRFKTLGYLVAIIGVAFLLGSGYALTQVQAGYKSLQSFSAAQNVLLSYNDQGELIDRGKTEGARAIMRLLTEDWGYPVRSSELDPKDPLVNTASEYMYQMATIGYHVLHGTQTISLEQDVEYKGQVYPAGVHKFPVEGRYWTGFDRMHPLEGPARGMAWSGTAHGLIAELGVGTVTASTLELGLAVTALIAGVGGSLVVLGLGLVWASSKE